MICLDNQLYHRSTVVWFGRAQFNVYQINPFPDYKRVMITSKICQEQLCASLKILYFNYRYHGIYLALYCFPWLFIGWLVSNVTFVKISSAVKIGMLKGGCSEWKLAHKLIWFCWISLMHWKESSQLYQINYSERGLSVHANHHPLNCTKVLVKLFDHDSKVISISIEYSMKGMKFTFVNSNCL